MKPMESMMKPMEKSMNIDEQHVNIDKRHGTSMNTLEKSMNTMENNEHNEHNGKNKRWKPWKIDENNGTSRWQPFKSMNTIERTRNINKQNEGPQPLDPKKHNYQKKYKLIPHPCWEVGSQTQRKIQENQKSFRGLKIANGRGFEINDFLGNGSDKGDSKRQGFSTKSCYRLCFNEWRVTNMY